MCTNPLNPLPSQATAATEQTLGPTDELRNLIEQYISTAAVNYRTPRTRPAVRVSLANFFRFAVQHEKAGKPLVARSTCSRWK
jgi:hypothetical protein